MSSVTAVTSQGYTAASAPQPTLSASTLLPILTSLLSSSPSLIIPLLNTHAPLTHPSVLPPNDINKFLSRLNVRVTAGAGSGEKEIIYEVARKVVEMDEEGWVVGMYGKIWVQHLYSGLNSPASASFSPRLLHVHLSLLTTLIHISPRYPSFNRETILPIVVKVSQSLVGILSRSEAMSSSQSDTSTQSQSLPVIAVVLSFLPDLFRFSPTPHRPLLNTILPILHRLLIHLPSEQKSIRKSVVALLSTLHILSGKVASSHSWKMDLVAALQEASWCLDRFVENGLEVAAAGGAQGKESKITVGLLGEDDGSMSQDHRVNFLFRALMSWCDLMMGLMTYPTARPVSFPIGSCVAFINRCFSITYDTPFVRHIDSGHQAQLIATLPKLWVLASKVLGQLTIAVGDHLLPSFSRILDHTIFLLETLPKGAHASRLGLIRLHKLLISRLSVDPSSADSHVRLVKLCIASTQVLLETRSSSASITADAASLASTLDKKSKKRRRDAIEDALVGGLEGRMKRSIKREEAEVVLSSLDLLAVLHPHPAIPQHVLAFSLRYLLSLSFAAGSCNLAVTVSNFPTFTRDLEKRLESVLEAAMYLGGGSGSQRPWLGLIVAKEHIGSSRIGHLLHPAQPPLARPLPPVRSLAFYNVEADDQKEIQEELGVVGIDDPLPEKATTVSLEISVAPPARPTPALLPTSTLLSAIPVVAKPSPVATESTAIATSAVAVDQVAPPAEADVDMSNYSVTPEVLSTDAFIARAPSAAAAITQVYTKTVEVSKVSDMVIDATETTTLVTREGIQYDSDGEEIPQINLDSDSDEDDEGEEEE